MVLRFWLCSTIFSASRRGTSTAGRGVCFLRALEVDPQPAPIADVQGELGRRVHVDDAEGGQLHQQGLDGTLKSHRPGASGCRPRLLQWLVHREA